VADGQGVCAEGCLLYVQVKHERKGLKIEKETKKNRRIRLLTSPGDVIVTLYDEPDCEGNAEQKGAINCDGYCWPMTDPPKSVLLEAVYNSEHAPKGRVVLTDRDDIFDDVDRKGPRVEFFGGPRQGTNGSGVQHDFACAPDTVLAHGVIPPHHNASCFNLEDQITSRISGMIVRHLEVCPWEAERYRRVFWYKFPDEIIHHKYDWEKLRYEEYPEWAFMGLGGEPREVIPQAWTYTTEKEIDKAFIPWSTDTFDPEGFDASDMGPPLFHEGAPLYGAQIPVGMDFSNKMEDQPYQPQKEGTSMTGGVASGGGVLGGASGGGDMGGGALGMLGQAAGVGGLLGGL
jgi:hypothetical protein